MKSKVVKFAESDSKMVGGGDPGEGAAGGGVQRVQAPSCKMSKSWGGSAQHDSNS